MIELRMLGRLTFPGAAGGAVRALLGKPRRFALLAYLAAATPPGFHRRDSLLALFWPELDQEHARAALRQALHVVRDGLGADAVASRGDEEIGLDFAQVSCDVAAFERALGGGRLEEALDLHRGALLEGFFISDAPEFERWLETARARLQQAAAGAARTLTERYEIRADLTAAAQWARRAIELAPSDEGLVRRLMTLLDRQGDRAGVLEVYAAFARRIAAEYDAEPAAETQALLAAVRARVQAAPSAALPEVDSSPRLVAALVDREEGRPSKRWRGGACFECNPLGSGGPGAAGRGQRQRSAWDAAPPDPPDQQRPSVRFEPARHHARQPAPESRERFGRDHAVRAHRCAGPELCRSSGRAGARLRAAGERIRSGGHGGA